MTGVYKFFIDVFMIFSKLVSFAATTNIHPDNREKLLDTAAVIRKGMDTTAMITNSF